MNALYRIRDWIGLPPAFFVLLLLAAIPARELTGRLPAGQFEVSIEAPAPLPAPALPELVPSTVNPPRTPPAPRTPANSRLRESPSPRARALPAPESTAPPPSAPGDMLEPAESPLPVIQTRALSPADSPASATQPAALQETKGPGVEEAYIAEIRSNVQSRKRYPTGREVSMQRPSGTVRACMDLGRDGVPANDIIIERTSHSMILDAEARKLLRMGVYPPFPAGAFKGESRHRFCIHLDYAFQPSG